MGSYELTLPPIRPTRNPQNGRFLKGIKAYNKGQHWDDFASKEAQEGMKKGWGNVGRQWVRGKNSGRPQRAVIAIMNDGHFLYFKNLLMAANWCQGSRKLISRTCHENLKGLSHKHKGIIWHFEDDEGWVAKVKMS